MKQLELVRRLAGYYFEAHDNAWKTIMAMRMKTDMDGYSADEQTEYLLAWLRDRGVVVNLVTCEISLVQEAA